jgi:parvulin-like peptidyl-prolyl isomerase
MRYLIFSVLCFVLTQKTLSQRNLFNQKYETLSSDFDISESQLEQCRNEGKLEIFNAEKHKTRLANQLLKMRDGKQKKVDKGYYKINYEILSKQKIPHYRVRYIYVDQTKFESAEKLEAYLTKVRSLLDKTAFKSVAMQYSMDYKKGVGGDSGWFKEGKTDPNFFTEVISSNKLAEEVFEFEIPQNNAYYFVQKTHAPTGIEEVLVLQTKED